MAENLPRNRWLEVVSFGLLSRNGRVVSAPVPWHEPVRVRVEAIVKEPDPSLNVGFALYAGGGELLFWSVSTDGEESSWPAMEAGRVVLETEIPAGWLNEGFYRVELIVSLHHREWLSQPGADAPSLTFEIAGGFGQSPHWTSRRPGLMAPVLRWQVAEERTDAGG
ncbi:MAG: hypothetical protein BWX64_01799 [Acidobacteria bacterium ADurb.Bin051]|nr:MAG: hypothetical protein BWX64_01799 [Acidobacteria bacterium ADurb.Bin051]